MPDSKPHLTTLTIAADSPRKAARHSNIELVCDNVYMVRGRMRSTSARPIFERRFLYYSRTMTIVRQQANDGSYQLTLINTVRLGQNQACGSAGFVSWC